MSYIVFHKCHECGHEEELPIINGLVQCPKCDTYNDVWAEKDEIPERHTKLLNAQKRMKRLLRYGKDD